MIPRKACSRRTTRDAVEGRGVRSWRSGRVARIRRDSATPRGGPADTIARRTFALSNLRDGGS
jgi:hypothetical protein